MAEKKRAPADEKKHREEKYMAKFDIAAIKEDDDAALQALVLKLAPGLLEWNQNTPRLPGEPEEAIETLAKLPLNKNARSDTRLVKKESDAMLSKEEVERRREEFRRKEAQEALKKEEEMKRKAREELEWAVGTMKVDSKEEIAVIGEGGRKKAPEPKQVTAPVTYSVNLDKELSRGIKKVRKMTVDQAKQSGVKE